MKARNYPRGRVHLCAERITGVVAAVNDRGLRLAQHDRWFTFTKFCDIPRPLKGQVVEIGVSGWFINQLAIKEASP